ncbi:MAG: RluA family pseudouridine synthase [Gammaproteobacteria bacterium]|nr:RluA family pseudouridine synthase [Gammaproteobacteria bacterium]
MPNFEYHINITQSESTAATLLSAASGLSLNQIKQAMQKGAVWLSSDQGTRRLRRAKKTLSPGNQLHFYFNPAVLEITIPEPTQIADEDDYSIWIKPRSVLSQGSKWGDHCAIARWIESHDHKQRPAFAIHRLDKAASGLMLIGHGKKTTSLFGNLFAKKLIEKKYHVIVPGQFKQSKSITYNNEIDGKPAVSNVQLLRYHPQQDRSLLEISIETGRKHQIRKHLSEAGYPIIGDRLYGGGDKIDLQLTAVSLAFECPLSGEYREYRLPRFYRLAIT